jgi:hypothetical protein
MNNKTLVLHAGPHKTGSTYLQYRLNKARGDLAAQSWSYPNYHVVNNSHVGVYSWLSGKGSGEDMEASFKNLVSEQNRWILSCEDYIYLSKEKLLKLKSFLDGFNVQVVLYVRTPVDLWPSHWQELIRHGRDVTLLEYLAGHMRWTDALEPSIMNPFVQANKFSNVFGRDSIRMFCYENVIANGGDLFEHFWTHILGISETAPYEAPRKINASQPAHKVEMLRCLNETHYNRFGVGPNLKVLKKYQTQQARIEAMPEYEQFKNTLMENATVLRLNSNQELFRLRENMLLNNFGANIENKASAKKLYEQEVFERKISCAQRYWIDRFGLRPVVEGIYEQLQIA